MGNLASSIANAIKTVLDLVFGPLFEFIGNFFELLWEGLKVILEATVKVILAFFDFLNPTSPNFFLKGLFEFIGDFFKDLGKVFIPDEDQSSTLSAMFLDVKNDFSSKFPIIEWFSDTISGANSSGIANGNFLKIQVPAFKMGPYSYGGDTYIDVASKYEPYRENIRSKLVILTYFAGSLVLVRMILNLTGAVHVGVSSSSKNGGDKE